MSCKDKDIYSKAEEMENDFMIGFGLEVPLCSNAHSLGAGTEAWVLIIPLPVAP